MVKPVAGILPDIGRDKAGTFAASEQIANLTTSDREFNVAVNDGQTAAGIHSLVFEFFAAANH